MHLRGRTLVIVGNGMVGHKLVETMVERDGLSSWEIVVFCEEPRVAYDRVGLSTFFKGARISTAAPSTRTTRIRSPESCRISMTMRTLHLGDDQELLERTRRIIGSPPYFVIANTGIGMRAWFDAADRRGIGGVLAMCVGEVCAGVSGLRTEHPQRASLP